MQAGGRRVIIENVKPEIDGGRYPIKRVIGEKVVVMADIFADGHDTVSANLLYRGPGDGRWKAVPMRFNENDRWQGESVVQDVAIYRYTIEGWVDHFKSWQKSLKKKFDADQDLRVDILIGVEHIRGAAEKAAGEDKK